MDCPLLKVFYSNGLSVAKSVNRQSVAKIQTVELSVAKYDVRCYIYITTASIATAVVRRYSL
jgi:hypothetical protein